MMLCKLSSNHFKPFDIIRDCNFPAGFSAFDDKPPHFLAQAVNFGKGNPHIRISFSPSDDSFVIENKHHFAFGTIEGFAECQNRGTDDRAEKSGYRQPCQPMKV